MYIVKLEELLSFKTKCTNQKENSRQTFYFLFKSRFTKIKNHKHHTKFFVIRILTIVYFYFSLNLLFRATIKTAWEEVEYKWGRKRDRHIVLSWWDSKFDPGYDNSRWWESAEPSAIISVAGNPSCHQPPDPCSVIQAGAIQLLGATTRTRAPARRYRPALNPRPSARRSSHAHSLLAGARRPTPAS